MSGELFTLEPERTIANGRRAGLAGMLPLCPACGSAHTSGDTSAVGRFNPNGPDGYMARFPGSPVRCTRDEALQDICDHRSGTAVAA